MPQAGLHAIAGTIARRWLPQNEWLLFGVVLGNLLPDLDNLAVAYATLTGGDTHGLHRTFTHSLFTILAVWLALVLLSVLTKDGRWGHFGLGLGVGMLMHTALDLVLWFNGVEVLWPIRYELNFWRWFIAPDGLSIALDTGEFLAFGLYFLLLHSLASRVRLDAAALMSLRVWMYIEFALFILFTVVFFTRGADGLPYTIFGALYLASLLGAIVLTIRLRRTIGRTGAAETAR